jgi:hypothetical protein
VPPTARTRVAAAVAAVVTVGLGLGLVARGVVGAWSGGVLYTVLLWELVVLVAPRARPGLAAGVALAVSWAVELSQLSPYPAELARRSVAARLVLGSTFDASDLPWYAVGAAVALLLHRTWLAASASRSAVSGRRLERN